MIWYVFSIKETGWADDDPHYAKWSRRFSTDAEAELFARRLSEDKNNAFVLIKRGDSRWSVRSGNLDKQPRNQEYDASNYQA